MAKKAIASNRVDRKSKKNDYENASKLQKEILEKQKIIIKLQKEILSLKSKDISVNRRINTFFPKELMAFQKKISKMTDKDLYELLHSVKETVKLNAK